MSTYSETDVINALQQVNKNVINHPQVSGTDYGIDETSKQLVIRIYTKSLVSHGDLGIAPVINNVPVKIVKEGPFKPH